MRRHPALVSLSRDHHQALAVALRLRRATARNVDDAAAFAAFWEPRGRRHFEIEEELLLPAIPATDAVWTRAADRVRAEHGRLRDLATLLSRPVNRLSVARDLGQRLHDHVRFEERELFVTLEERLSNDELGRLAHAIAAAEAKAG